ncbi:MAG: ABC transporter ATP-binding protein [Acidimicrobiales bacterium]
MTAPDLDAVESPATDPVPEAALRVLRRGLAGSPELRRGLVATAGMGLAVAAGRLTIAIVIQRALDDGRQPDGTLDVGAVVSLGMVATAVIVGAAVLSWLTQRRLVDRAEAAIAQLRIDAFDKIHTLSVADHNDARRGLLVARVTSDAEALARFAQWGLYSWTIHPVLLAGTLVVIAVYSWPMAIVVGLAYAPVFPWFRWLQRRQLAAYDELRTRVSDMLTAFSEAVSGAAVIRAYGIEDRTRRNLSDTVRKRYGARMRANRYMAGVFVTGDLLGAVAFAAVLVVGVLGREPLGLAGGELVALLFLTTQINAPIGELGETLDQTQTAVAGWRRILDLLDRPADVVEPTPGRPLPPGALSVEVDDVAFAYRTGARVLDGVTVAIPAGANVAVVGETGSGKTTFASLLCRLADPVDGRIRLGGVPLTEAATASRLASVRMVPQDGFLFDSTVRENIRYGSPGASDDEIDGALGSLGLDQWVASLGRGLDHEVGERGENLSVGERQLVALCRAALADPGLLVLDEATSAVDPETDRALTDALRILAAGRTMVSVAHRLATAEAADLVLVFDRGRLVQVGPHHDLVGAPGPYRDLHRAWVGNTRGVDRSARGADAAG